MKAKKADIDIKFLLEMIIVILFIAAVAIFYVMKFQPGLADYVSNFVVKPLKG